MKTAFTFTEVSITDDGPIARRASRLVDTYDLGGIVPPGSGISGEFQYRGAFDIPGPLLADTPISRDVIEDRIETTGFRQIDASIFAGKVGAWVELPISQSFSVIGGGGLSLAFSDTRLRIQEETRVNTLVFSESVDATAGRFLVGGYADAGLRWRFSKAWDFTAGLEYQGFQNVDISSGGRRASLRLTESFSALIGVGTHF